MEVIIQFKANSQPLNFPFPSEKSNALQHLVMHTNEFSVEGTNGGYNLKSAEHAIFVAEAIFELFSQSSPPTSDEHVPNVVEFERFSPGASHGGRLREEKNSPTKENRNVENLLEANEEIEP